MKETIYTDLIRRRRGNLRRPWLQLIRRRFVAGWRVLRFRGSRRGFRPQRDRPAEELDPRILVIRHPRPAPAREAAAAHALSKRRERNKAGGERERERLRL
jgi:hypothetical protein